MKTFLKVAAGISAVGFVIYCVKTIWDRRQSDTLY